MLRPLWILPLFTTSLLLSTPLSEQGTTAMRQLYLTSACSSCHGLYGEGMGASPRLQGTREAVILRRLQSLQEGKTRTAFGTIMVSFARSLDENQTKMMAKYLANLKTTIPEDRYDIEYTTEGDGGS